MVAKNEARVAKNGTSTLYDKQYMKMENDKLPQYTVVISSFN